MTMVYAALYRKRCTSKGSKGAVLWLPDVCCTCLHFFKFSGGFWILAVLGFTSLVSSRHAACNERLIVVFWSVSTELSA